MVPAAGGQPQTITSDPWFHVLAPEWLPGGGGLIASAGSTHGQLWEFPYPSGRARRITHDLFRYGGASITADSRKLVAVQEDQLSSIWVGPSGDPDQAHPVTPRGGHFVANYGLTWMPDGRIIYWTNATDRFDFITMGADGSGSTIVPLETYKWWPEVCSDGRTLLFAGIRSGQYTIVRSDLDGSNAQPLTQKEAAFEPHCSPDGQWVVYTEMFSATPRKVPIGGGQSVQLTDKPCLEPGISPDGRWIACISSGERSRQMIEIIPFAGGKLTRSFEIPATYDGDCCPLRWTPDGRGITYPDKRGGVGNLYVQPLSGGPPHPLTHFVSERIESFAWSQDGKQIAIARGTGSSDAVLMTNFR